MRPLILIFLLFSFVAPAITTAEPPPSIRVKSGEVTKVKVFKSLKSLERKFGKTMVEELKEFDFKNNVLIWRVSEFDPDAKVSLSEVVQHKDAAYGDLRLSVGPSLNVYMVRTSKELTIRVTNLGSYCHGGMVKPPEQMERCRATYEAEALAARKTVVLVSTPRKGLRVVKVTDAVAEPRP